MRQITVVGTYVDDGRQFRQTMQAETHEQAAQKVRQLLGSREVQVDGFFDYAPLHELESD